MPGPDQHPDFPIPNYRRRRPFKASDYRSTTDTEAIHPSYPSRTQTHEILDRGDATTFLKLFRVQHIRCRRPPTSIFVPPSTRHPAVVLPTPISSHEGARQPAQIYFGLDGSRSNKPSLLHSGRSPGSPRFWRRDKNTSISISRLLSWTVVQGWYISGLTGQ